MSREIVKNTCYVQLLQLLNQLHVLFDRIRLAVTNPLTVRSLNRSTVFKYLHKSKFWLSYQKNYKTSLGYSLDSHNIIISKYQNRSFIWLSQPSWLSTFDSKYTSISDYLKSKVWSASYTYRYDYSTKQLLSWLQGLMAFSYAFGFDSTIMVSVTMCIIIIYDIINYCACINVITHGKLN